MTDLNDAFEVILREFQRVQSRIDALKPLLKTNKEAFAAAKAAGDKEKMGHYIAEREGIDKQLHSAKEDIYALNVKAQEFQEGFDWFDYIRSMKTPAHPEFNQEFGCEKAGP